MKTNKQQEEKLVMHIILKYKDDKHIIESISNRAQFDELEIEVNEINNTQFIQIGKTIHFEDLKLEVVNINFEMFPSSPADTDKDFYNCVMKVFVEDKKS